ncbi:MAG TPA: HAMP domain-containing sensor histidine kinase, partial [Victivallales bacterium]|nr:HAMP domain-containing sensor histidine kinase [Victivallales bacterium]
TKDYLNLAKIESGELNPEFHIGVNFRELLEDSLSILETQIKGKKCKVECEFRGEDLSSDCDPDLIKIVLINLIGNAVKYGNEGCRVKINAVGSEKEISVSVWNEGPGFSQEDKSNLFRKFSRLKRPELMRQKGSGVGLYTVWQVISAHGGKVSADSELGKWAEFKFIIPRHQKSKKD